HDIGLFPCQAERWSESQDVSLRHGATNHAVLEQRCRDARSDLLFRFEEDTVVTVAYELDRRQQPLASYVSDMRVVAHRILEALNQVGADARRIGNKIHLVDQFEIGDAGGRAKRMGGIGPAMTNRAMGIRAPFQDAPDLL